MQSETLFETVWTLVEGANPAPRRGRMFGCPAAYVGRRLAFCVYGDALAVKLPAAEAAQLIAAGDAQAFRPFGRPPMKEWVQFQPTAGSAAALRPVLALALKHANQAR